MLKNFLRDRLQPDSDRLKPVPQRLRARTTARCSILFALTLVALSLALACGGGESGQPLTLVNQNILHGLLDEDPAAEANDRFEERLGLLATALTTAQPDIIFLQEVYSGEDYPDVRQTLLGALGEGYTAVFGDIRGGDSGQLGQLTLTRLEIVSSENRSIGTIRAVHRVTLQTEQGPIDVYNAHLDGTDEEDPQFAVDEMQKVLDFIEETRTGSGPVILAGDMNAVPGDPSIQAILNFGFVDALPSAGDATCMQAGDAGCTNSTIPLGDNAEKLAARRIDFIFVLAGDGPKAEVTQASLFHDSPIDLGDGHTLWLSDHIGVQATVEVSD